MQKFGCAADVDTAVCCRITQSTELKLLPTIAASVLTGGLDSPASEKPKAVK